MKEKAVEFEKLDKSRTYLLCEEQTWRLGEIKILAYFTVAQKMIILPEYISNRQRKRLDGYSGKQSGNPVREIPCYLIGQLAKNSIDESKMISGKELLEMAISVILTAYHAVGGRWIMIECLNKPALRAFYENNHFRYLDKSAESDSSLVQMIRKLEVA